MKNYLHEIIRRKALNSASFLNFKKNRFIFCIEIERLHWENFTFFIISFLWQFEFFVIRNLSFGMQV